MSRATVMSQHSKDQIDSVLCRLDDDCIMDGNPILSVLVTHDNGRVSTAFWHTVRRHGLRRNGENDDQLVKRLRQAAFTYYGGQH